MCQALRAAESPRIDGVHALMELSVWGAGSALRQSPLTLLAFTAHRAKSGVSLNLFMLCNILTRQGRPQLPFCRCENREVKKLA